MGKTNQRTEQVIFQVGNAPAREPVANVRASQIPEHEKAKINPIALSAFILVYFLTGEIIATPINPDKVAPSINPHWFLDWLMM